MQKAVVPKEAVALLNAMKRAIKSAAPKAEETISYGIPTFDLNGRHLVHVAAYAKHIGFYPTSSGVFAFQKELTPYKTSKGAVQFPLDKPLPLALIKRMVRFRVQEEKARAKQKPASRVRAK
jgi:uncharacterized protein YdhG (YjbR/CyaY superfamily)